MSIDNLQISQTEIAEGRLTMKLIPSIWKARIFSLLILVGAFFFFNWTLHQGFFPGEAARQAAVALGAEPGTVLVKYDKVDVLTPEEAHRLGPGKELLNIDKKFAIYRSKYVLWRTFTKAIAGIDYPDKAKLLNTFSAVCGAFAVMLAFMVFRCVPLFRSFHSIALSAKMKKRSTYLAGFVGAVALMTSMPFWLASTRFLPHAFETLLILLTAWTLLSASIKHSPLWIALFGVLVGMSIFECDTGLFLLPFWCIFAIGAMRLGEIDDAHGLSHLLIGLVAGIICYIAFAHSILQHEIDSLSVMLPFKELYSSLDRAYQLIFGGGFYETPRLLLNLFFGIIPFVAASAMYIWRTTDQAQSSGGFLFFVLACTASVAMVNTSVSPWGAVANDTGFFFPTTVYLMNAFVVSYLVAQGAFMAGGMIIPPPTRKYRSDDDRSDERRDYPVGRLLLLYITAYTFIAAAWNYSEIRDWNDNLVNKFAKNVTDNLGDCSWFMTRNSDADYLVKVHAALQNKQLTVFCIDDSASENVRFKSVINSANPVFKGVDTNLLRESLTTTNSTVFAETWISSDTNIARKVIVEQPDDFTSAGISVVPNVASYRALKVDEEVQWSLLTEKHLAFWKDISQAPVLGKNAPSWLRHQYAWICNYEQEMAAVLADGVRKNGELPKAMEILSTAEELLKK